MISARTAKMHAKKDWFVKACSSSFHDSNDEDLKVIDVTPIDIPFLRNTEIGKKNSNTGWASG